jgi:predicted transcriptional regulator
MIVVTASEAHARLYDLIHEIAESHVPVTITSLRVAAELRAAAESVLESGETLSSFVEHSLRVQIERRQAQREFIARGLAARDEAQRTGEYFGSDEVLAELDARLDDAEAKAAK